MKRKILCVIALCSLLTACAKVGENVPDKKKDGIPVHGTVMTDDWEVFTYGVPEEDIPPYENSGSEPEQTEPVDESSQRIELTYYKLILEEGDSSMPIVTMHLDDDSDLSEIWTSSDENIATVDSMGNITALSCGKCVITVQSAACPEVSASVDVTVVIDEDDVITDIELSFYSDTLEVGETVMPYVTMYPEEAWDKSEIWTSSDESVATVDRKGNITARSSGNCIITVQSAAYPDVKAEVEITVIGQEQTEPQPQITEPAETTVTTVTTAAAEPSESGSSVKGATYINGILVVNKTYGLPEDYAPGVNSEAKDAFDEMSRDAAAEGLNLYISSGFRSYEYQKGLYERYVERSGKSEADRYSARAGFSEHQTGLAFDLNSIDMTFADTDEYVWLKKHCAEYGFIIRYPEDGESSTGYMYEPWHIRYLGKETARKVYDSGLTLEDYLGIDSKYKE